MSLNQLPPINISAEPTVVNTAPGRALEKGIHTVEITSPVTQGDVQMHAVQILIEVISDDVAASVAESSGVGS